jgi:hypothetical protein
VECNIGKNTLVVSTVYCVDFTADKGSKDREQSLDTIVRTVVVLLLLGQLAANSSISISFAFLGQETKQSLPRSNQDSMVAYGRNKRNRNSRDTSAQSSNDLVGVVKS